MTTGSHRRIGPGSRAAAALAACLALLVRCEPAPTAASAPAASATDVQSFAFSDVAKKSLRGGLADGAATPRRGGTIVQYISGEYKTLHNICRTSLNEETFCRTFLFPPLLDLEPDTLELVPLLAQARPTISADQKTYTWKLRPGVRWHQGRPDGTPVDVTAADVEFSWRMMSDPKVLADRARASVERVASVQAVDRYTFVVVMKEPYFKNEFEFGYNFRIMPEHLAAHDPESFNQDPLSRAPVGYGPFKFDEWKRGEYVALSRNPDWFAADQLPYYIEKMRIHFITDTSQAPALFERGELSLCTVQDVAHFEELKLDAKWRELATFHEYYLPHWIYISWNTDHFAFRDARVRRAMTMLYPRELVRDKVYRGHAIVISGPWPATAKEYDATVAPLPFDADGARRLFAEAGWKDSDGDGWLDRDGQPFRFTLKHTRSTPPALATGNLWFQEQLKNAGIDMQLLAVDDNQCIDEARARRFDAVELKWGADPRDDDLFDRFHSSSIGGSNYSGYRSAECDRLLEAFRGEFDDARRIEIAHAIHRRIAEDQPCTFLYTPQSLVLATTKLRNVKMHRLGARWFDWWFDE